MWLVRAGQGLVSVPWMSPVQLRKGGATLRNLRYGIVLDGRFLAHSPPEWHPEQPDRIRSIQARIQTSDLGVQLLKIPARCAEAHWIQRVHTKAHWELVESTSGQTPRTLNGDTFTSSRSFETALFSAGSVVELVHRLFGSKIDTGFALIRPPGHHAESNRVMGFCLFNNVAVAAEAALQDGHISKVAIVDFDVHHGNGTQEIFYSRSDVLYISIHQYPLYPGTGWFDEVGEGEGRGFTVNFPIQAGMGNDFYYFLFRDLVLPILRYYRPELLLISAGYDAHREDPLAQMDLDEEGFGRLTQLLDRVGQEICQGRILYVLEGGYNLEALSRSVLSSIQASLDPISFRIPKTGPCKYLTYRDRVKKHLSFFWPL